MLGFGLSNHKIENALNQNEAAPFPGAFKPIIAKKNTMGIVEQGV